MKDGNRVSRHVDGVKNLVFQDGLKDLVFIVSFEWRLSEQHLIDQHTERPPVDGTSVLLFTKNLGSHELGGTAEGVGGRSIIHVLLAQTVIGYLDVSIQSQQNVVQLQITRNIIKRKTSIRIR